MPQSILVANDYKQPGQSLAYVLKISPSFWLTVILTASIILPWLRLREAAVRCEVLSDHALRIFVDADGLRVGRCMTYDWGIYSGTNSPMPGSPMSISQSPLMEWHSFATIKEPGRSGYSMTVSQAGDWTTKLVQVPPEKLCLRGIPVCGVVHKARSDVQASHACGDG
ncbi:hypothetical protein E1B28_007421 [Marasmius oreades]|uniref:Uncharacterized protein n=1 Tax=Marasmius oreades TaxID=181124 RepID=A0A9P7S260_9AGAR|nr:uncharacterized protein E1B28_007421 [Marasmius oreades]KAG7093773.1 hypothetical protein E1B28_007421 [Marasmius oreades]